jgi:hypothetical protein
MNEIKSNIKSSTSTSYELLSIDFSDIIQIKRELNLVNQMITGDISPEIISSEKDYAQIFKIRHDLIHKLICINKNLKFGEIPVEKIPGLEHIEHELWFKVRNQTPDSLIIEGNHVNILEISVSNSKDAERNKISKYSLLKHILEEEKFVVDLEVIVLNPSSSKNDSYEINSKYKLDFDCIISIFKILDNSQKLLELVQQTEDGALWAISFMKLNDPLSCGVSVSDVLKVHDAFEEKCFHNKKDLKSLLIKKKSNYINSDDRDFMNHICDEAMNMTTTLNKSNLILTFDPVSEINKIANTSDVRSILPLPFISTKVADFYNRSTSDDERLIDIALGHMKMSDDQILSSIASGQVYDKCFIRAKIPKDFKFLIALEGPGRKRFIKARSKDHIEADKKKKNLSLYFQTSTDLVIPTSNHLSIKDNIPRNVSKKTDHFSKLLMSVNGVGLDYLKCVQSIYREININALRRELSKNFILRPTSIEGLYVLIHPGPKLRVGENKSIIWFKILVLSPNMKFHETLQFNSLFKKMTNYSKLWSSDWLSVDSSRLDHYNRCYDRCLMAYLCYLSKSTHDDLTESWNNDKSNVLGLIIMTDLENRRSTSSMLQDMRYLFMSEFSIYKYRSDIIKKMCVPMRSTMQLFYFKKALSYLNKIDSKEIPNYFVMGKVKYDTESMSLMDNKAGVKTDMPRILSEGGNVTLDQILCEVYFCMLFNKDQDDPTHSSFQILTKMLEGEKSYNEVKGTGLHLGYVPGKSDEELASELIINPHRNQFSRRAIEIGSVLQSNHSLCNLKNGLSHSKAIRKNNVNKTLDQFATYKSSSVTERVIFEKVDRKEDGDTVKKTNQNSRRRCLEGAYEMLEKGHFRSLDLIKSNLFSPTDFHVFKKNQIGGVREILILGIEKRVIINIMESVSRNICQEDDREMLTHGKMKMEYIRNYQRELRLSGPKSQILLNFNFDKSKWGPSFMPIQFLYLFSRFKKQLGDMFNLFSVILIQHHNKRCFYPEHLIKEWVKDSTNKHKHERDPNLQLMKEKFLRDKSLYFTNVSNMGQGILHYTSSLLHLALISFRDEIYRLLLNRFGIQSVNHTDMVSSDDSFSTLSIPLDTMEKVKMRIDLFIRATEVSERLFNCWTSTTKSSISPVMYEFNSIFGSNMSSFPTTFKFAIASVQPMATDSFFRMVKQGYNASRQLFENGGSLELYTVSQELNKIYSETIYSTHEKGHNSLIDLGIRPMFKPYHLGNYPVFDAPKMLMFGPEYHNHIINTKIDQLNESEKKLFLNSHKINVNDFLENAINLSDSENVAGGLLRVEARMAPVRRLIDIRKRLGCDRDQISSSLMSDPLILFRESRSIEESKLKTKMKLYQSSASEALRVVGVSLYFGRVSASVSSNAFCVPGSEMKTFKECVLDIISQPVSENQQNLDILYPMKDDYVRVSKISEEVNAFKVRNPLEVRQIRKLVFSRTSNYLSSSISSILEYRWVLNGDDNERLIRDWLVIKKVNPYIRDTIDESIMQFKGTIKEKISGLVVSLMRLYSIGDSYSKAFVHGPSTYDPVDTYLELQGENTFQNLTSKYRPLFEEVIMPSYSPDKLYYLHNFALSIIYHNEKLAWHKIKKCRDFIGLNDDDFQSFINDNKIGLSIKKRIMMLYMYLTTENYTSWSRKADVILHKWLKAQKKDDDGKWSGDFVLLVQHGENRMIFRGDENRFTISCLSMRDLKQAAKMIKFALVLLQVDDKDLLKKTVRGDWLLESNTIIPTQMDAGFDIVPENIPECSFDIKDLVVEEEMTYLKNVRNEVLYKMPTGFLRMSSKIQVPDDINIKVFGLKWNSIVKLGAFNDEFELLRISPESRLEALDDLVVEKPKLSDVTLRRLGLYGFDKEEDKYEEVTMDSESLFSHFTNVESSEIEIKQEDDDPIMVMLADFKIPELYSGQDVTTRMIKTKSIWNKIKNLKHLLIGNFSCYVGSLNGRIINMIKKMTRNDYIYWSVLKLYDTVYTSDDISSPRGQNYVMDVDFMDKFLMD